MNKRVFKKNLVTGLAAAAVAVFAFVLTFDMPGTAPMFPRIASAALFLLGVLLSVTSLISMKRGSPTGEEPFDPSALVKPAVFTAMILLYVLGIRFIGFYVTTLPVLILYMRLLGIRSLKPLLITAAAVMALLYLVFSVGLHVPLPRGILI